MADGNRSSEVDVNDDHRDNSGGTSRPLPQLDLGDDVCQVPLWEREFCFTALNIPWETFCENKRYIGLFYQKVMDWDDSEARRNFEDAKERFRAKYFGEPFENPVLDPDMYIDKVDQPYCLPNDIDSNFFLGGSLNNWLQQGVDPDETPSGAGVKLNSGGRMWITGTSGSGGGRILHVGGGSGSGGGIVGGNSSGRNLSVGGGSGSGGGNASGRSFNVGGGSVRIWNVGGGSGAIGGNGNAGGHNNQRNQGGGGASGSNGNGGGRSNHRNQGEGQRQQRDDGGIHSNQDEGRRQMRCGCCWPQQRLRMKWRPMWSNRAPKGDPAA